MSRAALPAGKVRHAPLAQSVLGNVPPRRSGDTCAVFHPQCFRNDLGGLFVACTHGAVRCLGTFAPSIGVGGNLTGPRAHPTIQSVDVAPTASATAGAKSLPVSSKRALPEIPNSSRGWRGELD